MADTPGNGWLERFRGVERHLGRHDESLNRLYARTDDLPGLRVEMRELREDVKECREELRTFRRAIVLSSFALLGAMGLFLLGVFQLAQM